VRITRAGWEEALSRAVLTHPDGSVYRDYDDWKRQFDQAWVHVQWDPERNLRGAPLEHRSIQVGLSRHIVQRYVEEWTLEISDYTPLVRKLYRLVNSGSASNARALLPKERPYPLEDGIARRLGMR
jgi:hypothetical protein